MRAVIIILGLALLALAAVYVFVPAGQLPAFIPGFEAGSPRVHIKHGALSGVLGLLLLGFAWWRGR